MRVELIEERTYAEQMNETVIPTLAKCCTAGWMEPAQGDGLSDVSSSGKLHYLCYDAKRFDELNVTGAVAQFRGAIVISHGFTEFAEKYTELIWYFLLEGYSVCVLEHRGHGYSPRDVDDPSLVWIDDYRRYVDDLALFAQTIGRRYAGTHPLNLFAHSMGAGIGLAVMEKHPSIFDKAVLSCPMLAPQTGMPHWVAWIVSNVMSAFGFSKHVVMGHGDFPHIFSMNGYEGASLPRVRWYYDRREADNHYLSYSPTYGWVKEALRLSHFVFSRPAYRRLETPVLMFQAGRDVWVLNGAENRFTRVAQSEGGDMRLVRFGDAVHEIFSMPNAVLGPYLRDVFDFFEKPMLAVLGDEDVPA